MEAARSHRDRTFRLPVELILVIIDEADDKTTLQNWCEATRREPLLHWAAQEALAGNIATLTGKNCIRLSRDCGGADEYYAQPLLGRPLRDYLSGDATAGRRPRARPRVRVLDAHVVGIADEDARHTADLCLRETLFQLLPACTRLHELKIVGGHLALTALTTCMPRWRHRDLRVLRLHPAYLGEQIFRDRVGTMAALRTLELSNVARWAGEALGRAVARLRCLQRLAIVASKHDRIPSDTGTELATFFAAVFPARPSRTRNQCRLPPTLESLSISDVSSSPREGQLRAAGDSGVQVSGRRRRRDYPALRELCLDVESTQALHVIFGRIQLPALERLALSTDRAPPPGGPPAVAAAAANARLLAVLAEQPWARLREATLLNAWAADHRVLTDFMADVVRRNGELAAAAAAAPAPAPVYELSLGTGPPSSAGADASPGLFRAPDPPGGRRPLAGGGLAPPAIERLRFAHFSLEELDAAWLAQRMALASATHRLRVLAFRPRAGRLPRTFCWPDPALRCVAPELAQLADLARRFPGLRLVAAGRTRVWIERGRAGAEDAAGTIAAGPAGPTTAVAGGNHARFWSLERALEDATQAPAVRRALSAQDLAFAAWDPQGGEDAWWLRGTNEFVDLEGSIAGLAGRAQTWVNYVVARREDLPPLPPPSVG